MSKNVIKAEGLRSQLLLKDLKEGDPVKGFYLVKEKRTGTTRNGKTFLGLVLSDQSGSLEAKMWERAGDHSVLFSQGDIIFIEGHTESYRNQSQVRITALKPCEQEVDPALFLKSSPYSPEEMMSSLNEILRSVKEVHLQRLISKFLDDKDFVDLFMKAPAAKNFHHSYISGLLEHTLSVCRLSEEVARLYTYLDRDLLITAAFLHDIGKTKELSFEVQIDYTHEGRLLGHVVLGSDMVDLKIKKIKDFPHDLSVRIKHMMLSHHGEYEFGSPKRPKFLEAVALHVIDDLDAKVNGLNLYMEKDKNEGSWTEFNRMFGQYFLKGRIIKEEMAPAAETDEEERQGRLF